MERKLHIRGMTCANCEKTVKTILLKQPGIESASVALATQTAFIKGHSLPKDTVIDLALREAGYGLGKEKTPWLFYGGLLAGILAYFLVQRAYGTLNFDPTRFNLTYGLVAVYALISSLHCIGMCGGIALGSSIAAHSRQSSPWSYQLGRLISYTLSGFILGTLGSSFRISETFTDALLLLAGIWMILLAMQMAGVIRISFPSLGKSRLKGSSPFFIGLLNALMPCGSLQTMQVMALASASPWTGALIMLLFGSLTAPALILMQWVGIRLSLQKRQALQLASAVLVALLGIQILFRSPLIYRPVQVLTQNLFPQGESAPVVNGVQELNLMIVDGKYRLDAQRVKAGIPIRISFGVTQFLGCANPIEFDFLPTPVEVNVLENPSPLTFTLDQPGTYVIHCWMDMVRINLIVV